MRKYFLLFTGMFAVLSDLSAQEMKVVGYLPHYRFQLQDDIRFDRLTHLNLAFLNPTAAGSLEIGGQDITTVVTKARAANPSIQILIALAGGALTTEWADAYQQRMLPANRSAFIHQLIEYVETHQLNGIDVDLEWNDVTSLYSPFVMELADSLHSKGMQITAAWPATTRYADISDSALAVFDWINLMAYDLTGPWAPNNPGNHSPYSFANQGINFWKMQGVSADRMTLGVPFYGRDWDSPNTGQAFTYGSMIEEDSAFAYLDTVGQRYYNGIHTIRAKTELAKSETSGVMIWELGQDIFEPLDHLSLLLAIHKQLHSATSIDPVSDQLKAVLYPNPFRENLTIAINPGQPEVHIDIRDIHGRVLMQESLIAGQRSASWNLSYLSTGVYFFIIQTEKTRQIHRVVKR
ncbi:MAG: glycosyl hydrolase family 18 protein [Bacteroidota bacterium]